MIDNKLLILRLQNTSEQIQQDLNEYFDGIIADEGKFWMCQLVADRFNDLYKDLGIKIHPLVIPK